MWRFLLGVQKQCSDARIAQLPDGAVQNKVVNIYESREGEKACGKISVKNAADNPRPWDEERDSAGNQCHKITGKGPMGIAGRTGLLFLVIAGNPQILRGMEHGEQPAAVTSLWDFAAANKLNYRRQKKPEKLCQRQRNDRENAAEVASAGQRAESPATGTHKKERKRGSRGESEFSSEPERKDKWIAGRTGVEAQHQQNIGGDEGKAQRAAFCFRGCNARAPGKHHQQSKILSGVVPRAPADVEREDPWKQRIPEVSDDSSRTEQQCDMHRIQAIFLEFVARVVRAVDSGHEVRII